MAELRHKFVVTNGIRMHYVEAGQGPLVVLCHGFPELWYSWRHQIPALADAGFRVVAPDQRGYGQTDRPQPIEAYNLFQLTGDVVGLVNALGQQSAVIVGHDWGAGVAMVAAQLRPDLFPAVALLSVPFLPREPKNPSLLLQEVFGERVFYQQYFQEPGKAEHDLEANPRRSILAFLYSLSGDAPKEKRWRYVFNRNETLFDAISVPEELPPWLAKGDLEYFAEEFGRTGFRGGLNWYRNLDFFWEQTAFMDTKLRQPLLFIAGERDQVIEFYGEALNSLEANAPALRKKVILPGIGHWTQQESPAEVSRLLIEFTKGL